MIHFPLLRYGVAVLALMLALLLKLPLDFLIPGKQSHFLLFFATVMVSAWYGGLKAGLLTTVLAALAINYFFGDPTLLSNGLEGNLQLSLFILEGVAINWFVGAVQGDKLSTIVNALHSQHIGENNLLLEASVVGVTDTGEGIEAYARRVDTEESALSAKGFPQSKTTRSLAQQKESVLRDALQRFTFHMENLPLAVIEWDCNFRVERWSQQAQSLFGWEFEEVIGKHPSEWQFFFTEDMTAANRAIARLFDGSTQRNVSQNRNYTKDGRVVYSEWYNSALLDESGNLVSVLSLVVDITERQRVEEQLTKSEQRYRDLADAMPLIGWTAQPDGALDYYNQRWFDYTGMTLSQSKGWAWQAVLHPDDLQTCLDAWARAIRTGEPYEIEYRLKRKDGIYCWHLARAVPMRDQHSRIVSWVGTCTDIDDRKRTEEAERFLAQASEELASSLDYQTTLTNVARLSVPHIADWCAVDMVDDQKTIRRLAVAHVDPSKVEWANELQERYPPHPDEPYGVPNVLRTGQWELYPEVPDSILVAVAQDAQHLAMLRGVGYTSAMVVPLIARGQTLGAITFVSAESGRRYNASDLAFAEELARRASLAVDNARLFGAVQQELIKRKSSEQALRDRAKELAQLSAVLTKTNAALEKRNQELDQFAYIVSHDLKAPLRAIANLSTWIEEDIQDKLDEETSHNMDLLRGRVHRMEALINGLLQYSRVERVKTSAEPVDVESLLAEVIDSLAPPPAFTITVAPGMPNLIAERLPLQQVFANLIGNAIKHHHRPDGHVKISSQDKGAFYEFAVADDGTGIEPRYHDKIFVIFQTLEARDKVENTGVGLAIVKKIIENKGGTIRLESQLGQGATFYFTWPK